MVSKCANPNCFATFHYLHEGKLFVVDEHAAGPLRAAPHHPRCFWLCSHCAQTLTLTYGEHGGIRVVPVHTGAPECTRAAA